MAALVNYGSSDEEDNPGEDQVSNNGEVAQTSSSTQQNNSQPGALLNGTTLPKEISSNYVKPDTAELDPDASLVGPVLGPISNEFLTDEQNLSAPPQSPYSTNRALLRDLTLPTMPNYDIPASQPGSPVPSTNAKFKHFLELKKQGVHFNEKLAKSSALKNPSLMQKLMDFSDIDEVGQYSTTLTKDLWSPDAFPNSAFKEDLAKSQQKILKLKEEEKARGQREAVEFVPSISGDSLSRSGTPVTGGKSSQKSTAERIMAGLEVDRGRPSSVHAQGTKRKSRFDS